MVFIKLLLALCAFVAVSTSLQMTSVTYRVHDVQIDNSNQFHAAVFTITFDQNVEFITRDGKGRYTQSQMASLFKNVSAFGDYCFTPLPCVSPLDLAFNLSNTGVLDCPSEVVPGYPYSVRDSLPSNLIFFSGSTNEPFLNFFSQLGYISGYTTAIDDKRLYAFLILSYTSGGVVHFFDSKYRTVESDLQAKTCKFRFDSSQAPLLFLIGHNDNQSFSGSFDTIVETVPTCSYYSTLGIATSITESINAMNSAPDFTSLQLLQFKNSLLKTSDVIYGCETLIDSYISLQEKIVTYPNTTECVRSATDPLYSQDPCCNTTLQFLECCASADRDVATYVLNALDYKKIKCKNIGPSSNLLTDYIINTNNAEDPVSGCRSIAASATSGASSEYSGFIDYCLNGFYGADLPGTTLQSCATDDDCLTYCDPQSSYCKFDLQNPDPYMIDCHMQHMDPVVMQLLKQEWKLPQNTSISVLKQVYWDHFKAQGCVGITGTSVSFYRDNSGNLQWGNEDFRKPDCLADYYCTWGYGSVTSEAECLAKDEACTYDLQGIHLLREYPPYCSLPTATSASDCTAAGGKWDPLLAPWSCSLAGYTDTDTEDECLPPVICPPRSESDSFVNSHCAQPFCYDFTRNKTQCQTNCNSFNIMKWVEDVKQGPGFCQILIADQNSCQNFGYSWWEGRTWTDGYLNSKEECEDVGACMIGANFYVDTKAEDCAALTECSQSCHVCESLTQFSMCISETMSRCNCTVLDGTYIDNKSSKFCYFSEITEKADCVANNYDWLACSDLNRDQCEACSEGTANCPINYEYLTCQYNIYGTCPDKETCTASSGLCNDPFLRLTDECEELMWSTADCQGICMHALEPSINGQWGCFSVDGEVTSATGCANSDISRDLCSKLPGHWWQESFSNQSACEAMQGCKNNAISNNRNVEDCQECGGSYGNVYSWNKGELKPGKLVPLEYIKSNWTTTNRWDYTLNYNLLRQTINRLIASRFSRPIQSESKCLYNPLLDVISHVACDCTDDPGNPPTCYNDGIRITSVGVQRFYAGVADSIRTNSIIVSIFANSLQASIPYLDMNIDIASATQFRLEQSLSIDALSSSLRTNPYAIVNNQYDAVVGQLVGDGAVISFFPANETRKRAGTPDFTLRNPIQICVQLRSDITRSRNTYPVADFAVSTDDYVTWTPIGANVTETDFGYCVNVVEEGNYFPILRIADWQSRARSTEFIEDTTVRVFIYIFGAIFIVLGLISAFQMYVGTQTMQGCVPNLAAILFFFMLLFNLVRGIYLLTLPSGKLENNQGVKYFLSEAPQFFFFSVYSVIIFLWAELSSTMIASKSFLYHFKYPFIFTNLGLYVLFVVSVSVFRHLNPHEQDILQKTYVYILAGCCLVAVIAFNWFGKKLLSIQLRARKTRTTSTHDSALRRMAITMVVSSLTLAAQIAFLFVITYDEVTPKIALVAYVLTEIIPSATLIYTLRPISRKLKEQTTGSTTGRRSTANSSGNKSSNNSNKSSSNHSKNSKNSSSSSHSPTHSRSSNVSRQESSHSASEVAMENIQSTDSSSHLVNSSSTLVNSSSNLGNSSDSTQPNNDSRV